MGNEGLKKYMDHLVRSMKKAGVEIGEYHECPACLDQLVWVDDKLYQCPKCLTKYER